MGDIAGWIDREELEEFDIFTYTFGDNHRLYLRGQFASHLNNDRINKLWLDCPELTTNLQQELFQHTGITERCYSFAVAKARDVRVKFATKAFTDFGNDNKVFLFDGRVGMCTKTGKNQSRGTKLRECHKKLMHLAPRSDAELFLRHQGLAGLQAWVRDEPPLKLNFTQEQCADWWTDWRVCVTFPAGVEPKTYAVVLFDHQAVAMEAKDTFGYAAEVPQAAFFHFQLWKSRAAWNRTNFKRNFPLFGAIKGVHDGDGKPKKQGFAGSRGLTEQQAFVINVHGMFALERRPRPK